MELKDAKKLIKKIGVKSWIESGTNVVKVGDKLRPNLFQDLIITQNTWE